MEKTVIAVLAIGISGCDRDEQSSPQQEMPAWISSIPGTYENPFSAAMAYRHECTSRSKDESHENLRRLRAGEVYGLSAGYVELEFVRRISDATKPALRSALDEKLSDNLNQFLTSENVRSTLVAGRPNAAMLFASQGAFESSADFERRRDEIENFLVATSSKIDASPIYFLAPVTYECAAQDSNQIEGFQPSGERLFLDGRHYDPDNEEWLISSNSMLLCNECSQRPNEALPDIPVKTACLADGEAMRPGQQVKMATTPRALAAALAGDLVLVAAVRPGFDPTSMTFKLQALPDLTEMRNLCSGEIVFQMGN